MSEATCERLISKSLDPAINLPMGPQKIKLMQQTVNASTLEKNVGQVGQVSDVSDLLDKAVQKDYIGFAEQGAIMTGDMVVKKPYISTLKLGLDMAWIGSDYYVVATEHASEEKLLGQLNENRRQLSDRLKKLKEEQKRRNVGRE